MKQKFWAHHPTAIILVFIFGVGFGETEALGYVVCAFFVALVHALVDNWVEHRQRSEL